jgi:Family of unknown function (DUF5832)
MMTNNEKIVPDRATLLMQLDKAYKKDHKSLTTEQAQAWATDKLEPYPAVFRYFVNERDPQPLKYVLLSFMLDHELHFVKVRGVFDTYHEADKAAREIAKEIDSFWKIHIGLLGQWHVIANDEKCTQKIITLSDGREVTEDQAIKEAAQAMADCSTKKKEIEEVEVMRRVTTEPITPPKQEYIRYLVRLQEAKAQTRYFEKKLELWKERQKCLSNMIWLADAKDFTLADSWYEYYVDEMKKQGAKKIAERNYLQPAEEDILKTDMTMEDLKKIMVDTEEKILNIKL